MVLSSKPVYFFEEAMEIMVRTVNIEPITKEQEFLATPALTKEELTNAFEECLKQVDLNMEYFKDRFPYSCTKGLKYPTSNGLMDSGQVCCGWHMNIRMIRNIKN